MKAQRLAILTLTAAIAACAGTPGPGDSSYPYNVEGAYTGSITVNNVPFAGSLEVTTSSGGAVEGTFLVTQPVAMEVRLRGTILGSELTVDMTYPNNPATGCTTAGTVTGTLVIVEGGAELSGPVTIRECGQTLSARLLLTR